MVEPETNGTLAVPEPTRPRFSKADVTREVVSPASIPGWVWRGLMALSGSIDDAEREYGPLVYDSILKDPIAGASFDTLVNSVLSDEPTFLPAIEPAAGEERDADQEQAALIAQVCMRAVNAPTRPFIETLRELLHGGLAKGTKGAEQFYTLVTEGPDSGLYHLGGIKCKPNESWRFVVDELGNVVGIAGRAPLAEVSGDATATAIPGVIGDSVLLPPERFVIFAWDARDSDPRGHSYLRRIYSPFNFKVRTWPEMFKGLTQWAVPSVAVIMPEDMADPVDRYKTDGVTLMTAEEAMLEDVKAFQNGTALLLPFGSQVVVVESSQDGKSVHAAIDLFNREIVHGILGQTRATTEAEHGSKADSQSGQDVLGVIVRSIKRFLAAVIQTQILRPLVRLNWGSDAAARLVPRVTFGESDHQDRAVLMRSAAALYQAGYLTQSQLAKLDTIIGLPAREPGEESVGERRQTATATVGDLAKQNDDMGEDDTNEDA